MTKWPFGDLEPGKYGAILADPPWHFKAWADPTAPGKGKNYGSRRDGWRGCSYPTMSEGKLSSLPVHELAADDCVLFMWVCWPTLEQSLQLLRSWDFAYKTCGFSWMKADQYRLFALEEDVRMGLGYWTRSNSEVCLLATRGDPKRCAADVRQGIIEPIREHSRKPDCVHGRIEKLVAGPYAELFARTTRPGWDVWGNETTKFQPSQVLAAESIVDTTY